MYVADYGLLRKDTGVMDKLFQNSEVYLVDTIHIPGYEMHSAGTYPIAIKSDLALSIVADIYSIYQYDSYNVTFTLDKFYGTPDYFERNSIKCTFKKYSCTLGTTECYIYTVGKSWAKVFPTIQSGDWYDNCYSLIGTKLVQKTTK